VTNKRKEKALKKIVYLILAAILTLTAALWAQTTQTANLPPEKVGELGTPGGQIAFIRNDNLWVMDWDGKNQSAVVEAQNADGKLSWAYDNKRIAFTRRGLVDLKGPDNLGGQHKVYDIFIAYLDSAKAGNYNWWYRVTGELGGRHPNWRKSDGKIIFTQDINARIANATLPNYQTAVVDSSGGPIKIYRTDYDSTQLYMLMPTLGPDNQYAGVLYKGFQSVGIVVMPLDKKIIKDSEVGKTLKVLSGCTAPEWSPDGKWIAFVDTDMGRHGLYIISPDFKEKYLVYKPTVNQFLQTYPVSWSPNSKWLTFATSDGSIWIVDISGNNLRQVTGAGLNKAPTWSR